MSWKREPLGPSSEKIQQPYSISILKSYFEKAGINIKLNEATQDEIISYGNNSVDLFVNGNEIYHKPKFDPSNWITITPTFVYINGILYRINKPLQFRPKKVKSKSRRKSRSSLRRV